MTSETQLLQHLVDATSVPMFISRASDGLFLVANSRAADAIGVEKAALLGGFTPDYYANPGDRERILAMLASGDPVRDQEVEVKRADGSRFFAGATITPLRLGDVPVLIVCFVDLTAERALAAANAKVQTRARRNCEARARRAEARTQAIVDALPDMVFVLAGDGRFIDFTGPADMPTYVPVETFIGKHITEVLPPQVSSACLEALAKAQDTGLPQVAEYELEVSNGARYWEARLVPVGEGEVLGLVRNITTQIEARAALSEKNKRLLEQQKLEAVGQLAGGIAHDFNNSLSVILGLSTLAAEDLEPDSPLRQDLKEITGAAQRAATLTQHLLSFSRRHIAQPQDLDLNEATLAMEPLLQRTLGPGIELRIETTDQPLRTIIDPAQYEQVLQNMAANARDAMPEGGRLHIDTSSASLVGFDESEAADMATDYAVVTINDSGVGMDADVLKHLFEPFFTTRPLGQGTGLGLATCYGVVRQAGGRLRVRSEPGQGSTFLIYLPLHDASVDEPATVVPACASDVGHETVLLAEAEPAVLSLAMRALRRQGYVVLAASNGDDAVRVSRRHSGHIDLLLADAVMPRMNGCELAQVLGKERPGLRVVISTGGLAEHLADEQIDAVLLKPFAAEQLTKLVRRTLDAIDLGQTGTGRSRMRITGGGDRSKD